jgi:hypothetical protein
MGEEREGEFGTDLAGSGQFGILPEAAIRNSGNQHHEAPGEEAQGKSRRPNAKMLDEHDMSWLYNG